MQRLFKLKLRQLLIVGMVVTGLVSLALFVKSNFGDTQQTATQRQDCKSWKTTSQHKSTLISKTACVRNYFLLIVVSSAPAHFERRNLIRQTWGTDRDVVAQWKTFFLLGQTRNQTQSESSLLKKENNIYGDIIRADYYEHYWNQSLKIEMGFEWAARYCTFSFLLKSDDDVFVNTKDLIHRLQRAPKKGLYMGKRHKNPEVRRYGKFRVSYDEFSGSTYPNFCSGAGFVLSYDVVECLVPFFDVINPFRLDDVYVGILANKAGVSPVHHSRFVYPDVNYEHCLFVPNTLVQHRAVGQCLTRLFEMHSKDLYSYNLGSYF